MWAKFDDHTPDDERIAVLSDLAFRAWFNSICFCAERLTDGRVPQLTALGLARGRGKVVKELLSAGCWHQPGETCKSEKCSGLVDLPSTHYLIHQYLKYNPTRAYVEAERALMNRRFALNANPEVARFIRNRDGNRCRYCGVEINWSDRKSPKGATYDHVQPVSKGGLDDVENIVACCRACNSRKGARILEEAGMVLLPAPNQNGIKPESVDSGAKSRHTRNPLPETRTPSSEASSPPPEPARRSASKQMWLDQIGPLSKADEEQFDDFERLVPAAWFREAIEETDEKSTEAPWPYCRSTLVRCIEMGKSPKGQRSRKVEGNSARAQILRRYQELGKDDPRTRLEATLEESKEAEMQHEGPRA